MSEETNATPAAAEKILLKLEQLINVQRRNEIATLTAALLSTRRKSLSINEMLAISRDIQYARFPTPNHPDYQEWEKTKDERLALIYK